MSAATMAEGRRPRVLMVSPIASHPANQGNSARIQTMGRELMARGLSVDFLYYGMEGLTPEQRRDMTEFWDGFEFMPSLPLAEPAFPSAWGLDDWCPAALPEAAARLHARLRYDAVIVNYVWMSRVFEAFPDVLRILDTHDMFADRHKLARAQGLEPRWYWTTPAEEERGFARADIVLAIQDVEAAVVRSRTRREVMTVGHAEPPRFLLEKPLPEGSCLFGYFGSGNPWNVRSVLALDGALAERPPIPWVVAGTISRRGRLSARSDVIALGEVGDVREFYGRVRCVLNPMLGGTGLKIKTVEALAFGLPLLGTPDAFVGIAEGHSPCILPDVEALAARMEEIAADPGQLTALRKESRRLFLDYLAGVHGQLDAVAGRIRAAAA